MFSKGEVVWAKLKGFPWWPAIISRIIDNKTKKDLNTSNLDYLVTFLGENSHATLPETKIEKFEVKYKEYSTNLKKKKLLEAIDLAKRLNEGILIPTTNPPIRGLKRKLITNKSSDSDSDIKKDAKKKLKSDNSDRMTRSRAIITKNSDFPLEIEKLLCKSGKSIEEQLPLEEITENKEISKDNTEKKAINVSSSLQEGKLPIKKAFKRSKMFKRALVSSKKKVEIPILTQKSVSDSTNDSLDKEEQEILCNLEKKLKNGIETIIKEELYDKTYPEIIRTITECVNDISKLFSNTNANILSSFLAKNIGKEMALLEKLCEENKHIMKSLFNIEYYLKELKKTNAKIESQVYYQFFDCWPLLNELNIPYPKKTFETSFFTSSLLLNKSKSDPYHTPLRNPKTMLFVKNNCFDENEPHPHSEISSINNQLITEELEGLKSDKNDQYRIENKQMRKKICHKMAQLLQEKHGVEKLKAQEITLQIEVKIRNLHPDMKEDYKEKIRILLKLIKDCKINAEMFLQGEEINFQELKLNMTPSKKFEEDLMSNDRFGTPLKGNLTEFTIKSQ